MSISPIASFGQLSRMDAVSNSFGNPLLGTPNWKTTPYKGMPRLSGKEMKSAMQELGKMFAEAKTDDEYNTAFARKDELLAMYISSASPDRKAMLKEAQTNIRNMVNIPADKPDGKHKPSGIMSIFDYISMSKSKLKVNDRGELHWDMRAGGSMTVHEAYPDSVNVQIHESGETPLTFVADAWSWTPTKAEESMMRGFERELEHAKAMQGTSSGVVNFDTKIDLIV